MAKNWYPFYVGDYARKTSHLTLEQHGAYRLLLDYYYSTGEPLPLDMKVVFRICRAHSRRERDSITTVIEQYFDRTATGFVSEKCSTVINKQRKYIETQSANAYAKWHAKPMPARASTKTKVSKDTISPIIPLPDWMPEQAWKDYKDIRKQKKSPMTAKAEELCIGKLDRWRHQGHDPAEILNNSVMNGYTGIFEPKENKHAHIASTRENKTDRAKAAINRAAEAGGFASRPEREASVGDNALPMLSIT